MITALKVRLRNNYLFDVISWSVRTEKNNSFFNHRQMPMMWTEWSIISCLRVSCSCFNDKRLLQSGKIINLKLNITNVQIVQIKTLIGCQHMVSTLSIGKTASYLKARSIKVINLSIYLKIIIKQRWRRKETRNINLKKCKSTIYVLKSEHS